MHGCVEQPLAAAAFDPAHAEPASALAILYLAEHRLDRGAPSAIAGAPAVAGGVAYVGSNSGQFAAFSAFGCGQALCNQIWDFIPQDPIVNSSPAVVNGRVYVGGATSGRVPDIYAFKLAPGT